jgi:hypothetical protein
MDLAIPSPRQIFEKHPNIKFYENISIDRHNETNSRFSQFLCKGKGSPLLATNAL